MTTATDTIHARCQARLVAARTTDELHRALALNASEVADMRAALEALSPAGVMALASVEG